MDVFPLTRSGIGSTNLSTCPTQAKNWLEWATSPVNALMGLRGVQLSLAELSAMGVKRISVGSALCRVALAAFLRAAREMREHGTFTFGAEAANPKDITAIFTSR
jgi:2-methylisocitrate lyase-like PEP mutase family enzyme